MQNMNNVFASSSFWNVALKWRWYLKWTLQWRLVNNKYLQVINRTEASSTQITSNLNQTSHTRASGNYIQSVPLIYGAFLEVRCVCVWMMFICFTTFVPEVLDNKVMAGETLERQTSSEPRLFHSLGIERFYFGGHEISIQESIDSYGALVWPGVRTDAKQTPMPKVSKRPVWYFLMWWELVIMCV